MKRIHFEVEESAVTIVADDVYHRVAKDAIFEARDILHGKIAEDPFFATTFYPYKEDLSDDPLVRHMCRCSLLADVGPMACVAGAVANHAVTRMVEEGAAFAIVENGGDIALMIDRPVTVGLFTGDDRLKDIAMQVQPRDGIFGICSSSGKIGPSVSFGMSDICTVISSDVLLADGCATAFGNLVKNGDDIASASERICSIPGVEGCVASVDGKVCLQGDVPELVRRRVDAENASRILL